MTPEIAIVGMACRYPDAQSPDELWENVLAQRRAFRRIPAERLSLADYYSSDPTTPDTTYATEAAVLADYEFDREKFRVSGSTFRAADLTHWLALDIASRALADAGFDQGSGLTKATTGVLVGNSLAGEFSRASLMRLRWPYVRRVVDATLAAGDTSPAERARFLAQLEATYKSPFPPVGDETLAGGLANTIAGRICNHFDFKGGGYTVDGACASSLLAVANSCSALMAGDLDVAVAGGVDLSLDPFELVGFAKVGALAAHEMRVYDARSAGFWPGEGCGMVVLMRHAEAVAQGRRIYAIIRGWGISSDGQGGLTRPEVDGQQLALERAYRRAGFGIDTVGYFEGHGTGTTVGDATELSTISQVRRAANAQAPPAAIGSIKANIGHAKAAAGVAGLIKAALTLRMQVIPPSVGWETPNSQLDNSQQPAALELLREGRPWPEGRPLRSAVSAMGFGGINTHVVLESAPRQGQRALDRTSRALLASAQDAELFLFSAADLAALSAQLAPLVDRAAALSRAELADLSAELSRRLEPGLVRAAVVASKPAELAAGLKTIAAWLAEGVTSRLDIRAGIALGSGANSPRVGFLFPGQGSPTHATGGLWRRRFDVIDALYRNTALPTGVDSVATEIAQPAICLASLAGLRLLEKLGIEAGVGVGHSLGELTAYCWAGAMDEPALVRLAAARGKAIAEFGKPHGGMASVAAGERAVRSLLDGQPVVVSGLNSPRQTIISGPVAAVQTMVDKLRAHGLEAVRLNVSHAFHSPLVADAAPALARHLATAPLVPLARSVASTITGTLLEPRHELAALLEQQLSTPVRLIEALSVARDRVELWIEVGPGTVLGGIVASQFDVPVVSLNACAESLRPLLEATAVAFAMGVPLRHRALFEDRFTRRFDLTRSPKFLANPCESAPQSDAAIEPRHFPAGESLLSTEVPLASESVSIAVEQVENQPNRSAAEVVRRLVAKRAELPLSVVKDTDHLLRDLHLSSLAVGHLAAEAARELGLAPPASPTDYAQATVGQLAATLEQLTRIGSAPPVAAAQEVVLGVDHWVRPFVVDLVERALPPARATSPATAQHAAGAWRVVAPAGWPLAQLLQTKAAGLPGSGVVLCLPPRPDERHVPLFLEAAGMVASAQAQEDRYFVVVQHGGGGGGFARTLHLERPDVTTCVIDVPLDAPQAVDWIQAEILAARGHVELHYDHAGTRHEPVWRLATARTSGESAPTSTEISAKLPLGEHDVLLVTGGGKGIAAECALALARQTGVKLALVGRSQPVADSELAVNLARMAAGGTAVRYYAADVCDPAAVELAVSQARADLGPITAILHGAGSNIPQLIDGLNESAFQQTLQPKLAGLRNVLSAIDPQNLRLLVSFGSIIARAGLRGEADYATANEWLALLGQDWAARHPLCRALCIEWSVWSGVGMGERLGRIDALKAEGISPITPDEGVAALVHLLRRPDLPATVVVAGRFGEPPTAQLERPQLPLWRFIERPRVHIPGVELIVDIDLSAGTDPHIPDHVFQGAPLFAAVMGLEAMAQVALALSGASHVVGFEQVELVRPIMVPEGANTTIRLAALEHEPGLVEVAVRAAQTAYQVDHFRAVCRVASQPIEELVAGVSNHKTGEHAGKVVIDPARDLYGRLLFHRGQFQRVTGYDHLEATACTAQIGPATNARWFGQYLSSTLLLGDPGARDAAIHAIQACIPHATILPIGVTRIVRSGEPLAAPCTVHAREVSHVGDTFEYDMEIVGSDGQLYERWEGLRLRQVRDATPREAWVEPLLGPYLQRRVAELIPGARASVAIHSNGTNGNGAGHHHDGEHHDDHRNGGPVPVYRRPDGKPETPNGGLSVAHAGQLILSVTAAGSVGCDLESITARPPQLWHDLLGSQRNALAEQIASADSGDFDKAATRMWAALECLKKAGASLDSPLVIDSTSADGWVLLRAGSLRIATYSAHVGDVADPLIMAILLES